MLSEPYWASNFLQDSTSYINYSCFRLKFNYSFRQGKCAKSFQRRQRFIYPCFLQEHLIKLHEFKLISSKKRRKKTMLNIQQLMNCILLLRIELSFSKDISSTYFDKSAAVRSFGWKHVFFSFSFRYSFFIEFSHSWAITIYFVFVINYVLWEIIPRRHNYLITSSRSAFVTLLICTCQRSSDA